MRSPFFGGIAHISDLGAYDHMLFIVALIAAYNYREWRLILGLVTAFTIGHSATLAWLAFNSPLFSSSWIETGIAFSIIVVGVGNLIFKSRYRVFAYGVAILFGLLHGMGFASFFRMMHDKNEPIFRDLLLFNLGIELGQLFIVGFILLVQWSLLKALKMNMNHWRWICSLIAIIGGLALMWP